MHFVYLLPKRWTTTVLRGLFPHKKAAVLAGLGFIGKNCLFISKDYGARVRLATVLTDLSLPQGSIMESGCENCDRCIRACECGALYGVGMGSVKKERRYDGRAKMQRFI